MQIRRLVLAALIARNVPLRAETLQEFLRTHGIPTSSVPGYALSQTVLPGPFAQSAGLAVAAWSLPGSMAGTWPLHLIRLDKLSGATTDGKVRLRADDICAGALLDIQLVAGFALLQTHINPSAGCLLVVDPALRLRHTFYGFAPEEVELGRVVLTENMIHFAPVHPERLQVADLASGETRELYPLKDDPLRAQLARQNAASMPSAEVCARMNDPCQPGLFDETIVALASNNRGRFAIVVDQEAEHRIVDEAPTKTVAEQSVLYIYQRAAAGWTWCEFLLSPH